MENKMGFDSVKDSGKRQEFNTGSVRDTQEGKGLPHLIAGEALAMMLLYIKDLNYKNIKDSDLIHRAFINMFSISINYTNKNENYIFATLRELIYLACKIIALDECSNSECIEVAFLRLAKHYENGAKKYSKNNWRLGQPVSRYYDSAFRHLVKIALNEKDEDHASAFLWNLIGMFQTRIDVSRNLLPKELDDFPFTETEIFKKEI
jgi:hypothetical protein